MTSKSFWVAQARPSAISRKRVPFATRVMIARPSRAPRPSSEFDFARHFFEAPEAQLWLAEVSDRANVGRSVHVEGFVWIVI